MEEKFKLNHQAVCEKMLLNTCSVHGKKPTILSVEGDTINFETCCPAFKEIVLDVMKKELARQGKVYLISEVKKGLSG